MPTSNRMSREMTLPVVNMQRDDFCVTLATSLAFLGLAVICTLWHPNVDSMKRDQNEKWIDVVILISTATSIILLAIAIFKLVCGRGELWAREDDYEEIEEGSMASTPRLRGHGIFWGQDITPGATPAGKLTPEDNFPRPVGAASVAGDNEKGTNASKPIILKAAVPAQMSEPQPEGGKVRPTIVIPHAAAHRELHLRPVEIVPLKEGEIDCGIEIECTDKEFFHLGEQFDAGTWRVHLVRQGSCCDRQGTCGPGDIILAIGGAEIRNKDKYELALLLRGHAGSSISIQVIHVDCRHSMTRHIILAPSAAQLGISNNRSSR
jgi:hypothetical protein